MLYGVILAAGSGRRMNLKLKKQYISMLDIGKNGKN